MIESQLGSALKPHTEGAIVGTYEHLVSVHKLISELSDSAYDKACRIAGGAPTQTVSDCEKRDVGSLVEEMHRMLDEIAKMASIASESIRRI